MKKKTRIVGAMSALAISMSMLGFGVYAASTVSLSVSSSVSFEATSVFLKAEGSVLRGTSSSSFSAYDGNEGGNYTYIGYSYNPDENGEPDGTSYTNSVMRDQTGSTAGWQIGDVSFTETKPYLQYKISFTNYSEYPVAVVVENNSNTHSNIIQTENADDVKYIDPNQTKDYTLTLQLSNFSSSINDLNIDLSFTAEKTLDLSQAPEVTVQNSQVFGGGNISFSNLVEGLTLVIDWEGTTSGTSPYQNSGTKKITIDSPTLSLSTTEFDAKFNTSGSLNLTIWYEDLYGNKSSTVSKTVTWEYLKDAPTLNVQNGTEYGGGYLNFTNLINDVQGLKLVIEWNGTASGTSSTQKSGTTEYIIDSATKSIRTSDLDPIFNTTGSLTVTAYYEDTAGNISPSITKTVTFEYLNQAPYGYGEDSTSGAASIYFSGLTTGLYLVLDWSGSDVDTGSQAGNERYYISSSTMSFSSTDFNGQFDSSGSISITAWYEDANGNKSPSIDIYATWYCLTGDTWVTMSDGKKKRLRSVKVGDKVLSVDPLTGKIVESEIFESDIKEVKKHNCYDKWTFSDGTTIKTVHRHRFYNIETKSYMHIDECKIGDHFLKEDGSIVELVEHKRINRTVRHFAITPKLYNYFANGLLNGTKKAIDVDYKAIKFNK